MQFLFQETAPIEQAPVVHDDGVFTLTIGPSLSTEEPTSGGASGASAVANARLTFEYIFIEF